MNFKLEIKLAAYVYLLAHAILPTTKTLNMYPPSEELVFVSKKVNTCLSNLHDDSAKRLDLAKIKMKYNCNHKAFIQYAIGYITRYIDDL